MSPIRLLQLMKKFDIGGVERSTINHSNKLADHLEYIAIFAGKGKLDHSNIISGKVNIFFSYEDISNPFAPLVNLLKIIRIIRTNKINVVHYHQRIYAPFIPFLKIFLPKVKVVYTHHTIFNDRQSRYLRADLFTAVSNAAKRDLEKIARQEILILKPGLDISEADKKIIPDVRNIGYVGRFDKVKGISLLLEAFRRISGKYEWVNLILIGEGEEKEEIKKFINKNALESRIFIKAPAIQLPDIYKGLDCLVLPSLSHEGFGMVLAEAMSFGIPVISSDLESLKEIVIHEITGLIFKLGNSDDLAEKLFRIIEDEYLRRRLAGNSIVMLRSNFNPAAGVKEYLSLLEAMI